MDISKRVSNRKDPNIQYMTEGLNHDFNFFNDKEKSDMNKIRVYLDPVPQSWPKESIIMNCFISKRGEKFGQFLDRYIVFTKEALHLFENKDRSGYKGSIYLEYCKTTFFLDENSQNRMGLRFIKNSIVEEFSTKDMTLAKRLKEELTKYSIQTDFYSKFDIISKIGEGHFASVHKVKNRETSELFAAKIYNKDSTDIKNNNLTRDCINQEISLMSMMPKHENLLHLYEVHETKNTLILVIDYLPGGELFEVMRKKGSFTFKEAGIIMQQCLSG